MKRKILLLFLLGAHCGRAQTVNLDVAPPLCAAETGSSQKPTAKPSSGAERVRKEATPTYDRAADERRKATLSPAEAAWEKTIEQSLLPFYLAKYKREKLAGQTTTWDYVQDDPKLPHILLIGDSISCGYTLAVRRALKGKANVHRAPENCGATAKGLTKLDRWLGAGRWDVIHFNFGLHDGKTKPEIYAQNLEQLVERMEKTGAKLIWASTTPGPPNSKDHPPGNIENLNDIAAKIMKKHGLPTDDLFTCIQPWLAEFQLPKDVHYNEAGYQRLGGQVAKTISETLNQKE